MQRKFNSKFCKSCFAYKQNNKEELKNLVSDLLSNNGFYETMANSLTKSKYVNEVKNDILKEDYHVKMLNPLSSDLDVMRQSLVFNGLEVINRNIKRKNTNLQLFEFGKTYHLIDGQYKEREALGIFCTGNTYVTNKLWHLNIPNIFFAFPIFMTFAS
mgnify:CR=1 FL=1